MRILLAKLLVIVTGLLIVMLAIVFALIRNAPDHLRAAAPDEVAFPEPEAGAVSRIGDAIGQTPQATTTAPGRAVFVKQRCRTCHAIDGEGNARSPLDGVGSRLTEKEIRRWIVAPQEMDPAVTKRGYQLSEEDLDALVAYLMALKPH
jgi:mono/diheme cytochrome c family protein